MHAEQPLRTLFGQFLATAALVFTLMGCVDHTGLVTPERSDIVRQGGYGCEPEVTVSRTDSTETVRTSFTVSQLECAPNLARWGIDMYDPVGVDTPQGDNFFKARGNMPASGMPSPPFVAQPGSYSPPQIVVEFDPPVRSVSFHYSRLSKERAMWGGIVEADSMMVRALSRTPGTLFYTEYARAILRSNVAATVPPWTNWTRVTLSAPGDQIQWLWFDGALLLDDFEITRAPLNCAQPIQRGALLRCVVRSGSPSVRWRFLPDNSLLDTVEVATADSVWQGRAAASGEVSVTLADGQEYKARVVVQPRPSRWSSRWAYREGPELLVPDAEPAVGGVAGRNCPEINGAAMCISTGRVQPDPTQLPAAGVAPVRVASGPNEGYWMVDSVRYEMRRVGNINPGYRSSSSRRYTLTNASKACKQALGVGPKGTASANFHDYNNFCASPKVNMAAFNAALLGHEGLGYNGGRGHESLARGAASLPANDPYVVADSMISMDSTALVARVDAAVILIDAEIRHRSSEQFTGGNYSGGTISYWSAVVGGFVATNIMGF